MSTKEKLITRLQQILPDILRDTPIALAYLYGSTVSGELLPSSDVDIALVRNHSTEISRMTSKERMQLEFDIEIKLEQHGVINCDVRIIDDLPLTLQGEAVTQGVRLYSKDEALRVEFETRTLKIYLDFQPTVRLLSQVFLEHVQKNGLIKHNGQSS